MLVLVKVRPGSIPGAVVTEKLSGNQMAKGGARKGAGRKPGIANRINREAREQAARTGELPLDYMLRVMRDEEADPKRRDGMAQAAAPYIHAKLASIEHTGEGGGAIKGELTVNFVKAGASQPS